MKLSPNISKESLCLEVTTECNSNCLHCFVHARSSGQSQLSIQVVQQIITEGYSTGFRQLHITGGEPLLWDGLFQSLDYAFDTGYNSVTLNTNGSLLTKDVAADLSVYGGLSISVSIDGPEMLHDRLRGNGSYKQAISGMNAALDADLNTRVFTVVQKRLIPILHAFSYDLFEKYSGIQYLTLIQLLNPSDDIFSLSKKLLEPDDLIKLVQTVFLLNVCGLKTKIKNNPLASIVSNLLGIPWIPRFQSLFRDGSMFVRADSDISLSHSTCCSFGNYKPGMIQQVMSSVEYKSEVAPDQSCCPFCKYIHICRQSGMTRPPEHFTIKSNEEVPYCRQVLDKITFLLSRTDSRLGTPTENSQSFQFLND